MQPVERVTVACDCQHCVRLCSVHPGWFAPREAIAAMEAGKAMSMMLDFRYKEKGRDYDVPVLSPAVHDRNGNDRGGRLAPQIWERVEPAHQVDPEKANVIELMIGTLHIMSSSIKEGGMITGVCVNLVDGKCALHDSGFKPIECRTGYGCGKGEAVSRLDIAKMWDTEDGIKAVAMWRQITGCEDVPFMHVPKGEDQ